MSKAGKETRIGIVGVGAIGQAILKAVADGTLPVKVAGVTSRDEAKARDILGGLGAGGDVPWLPLDDLVAQADLLIEAAGGDVVADLARRCFNAGKDLLVISIGALLDHPELLERARETGCRLLLPSGAIAGLDGLKSASMGTLERVTITTRKPPRGLAGAPYLLENKISLEGITEEMEVYSGPVTEAVRGFPANVNVSAAVSLAGIGPERTTIRILAVPGLERNCHTVEAEGEFGSLTMSITNIPSENPKTGRLTAMSMLRSIRDALDPVRIGT